MKRPVLWMVVFLLALASASSSPVWAQKQDPREVRARELFALGQYAEALDIYGKLYAETTHPTYVRNIGRCYQNMGEPDKAIPSFREYLRQARELAPDQRAQVEGYIREMEDLKRKRENAGAPATAPPALGAPQPGPGQPPAPAGAATPALGATPPPAAGPTGAVTTALEQTPPPTTPGGGLSRRVAGYVVGGASVAALAVGAVFGLRAIQKRHDSDANCPMGQCTTPGVNLNNEAKTAARISDVVVGAGLVGAAIATYLLVTAGRTDAQAPAAHAARGLHLSPEIGPGAARLALGGSW